MVDCEQYGQHRHNNRLSLGRSCLGTSNNCDAHKVTVSWLNSDQPKVSSDTRA